MSYISEISHDILIKEDDKNLLKASKIFLKNLENDYEKFNNEYKIEEKKWNDFFVNKSKNVLFDPEFLNKRSPITIINSKWGSGKTYFIEQLGKNMKLNNIKTKFSNFIIIDLWNFLESDEIISDIFKYLFYKLSSVDKKILEIAKEIANKGLKYLFEPALQAFLNIDKKMHKDKLKKPIEKLKIQNTIIIFDNLERMGDSSLEIMRLIQKLSKIENFVFILPMDIDKMNDNSDKFEKRIEKFIDLPSYDLKQDYISLLNNLGLKKEISFEIDKLLRIDIGKKFFSIRELKKIIQDERILRNCKNMSKLKLIFFLRNRIWKISNKDLFIFFEPSFIKFNFFLTDLFLNQNEIIDSFTEIFPTLNNSYYTYNWRNSVDPFFETLKSFFSKANILLKNNYVINFAEEIKDFFKKSSDHNKGDLILYDRNYFNNIYNIYNDNYDNLFKLINKIKQEMKNKKANLLKEEKINESENIKKSKILNKYVQKEEKDSIHESKIITLEKTINNYTNIISEIKIEIDNIDSLFEEIKIINDKFNSINNIFKKHISNLEEIYKKNLKKEYEFELINNIFLKLDNYKFYNFFSNTTDYNVKKDYTVNFFQENFDSFLIYFDDIK
ncbi:MAG: P-loop NTPase fold protein [Mycoplasmoidaceae bacterium]